MPGRKAVPRHLRVVRGNPGKRPLPDDIPIELENVEPPRDLDEATRKEWDRLSVLLTDNHLLSDADKDMLAELCEVSVRLDQTRTDLKRSSLLVRAPNGGVARNPLVAIEVELMKRRQSLLAEFGMSPSSRTKVSRTDGRKKNRFAGHGKPPAARAD
jgi:P27 family predicted phage terminase small subunit